METLVMMVTVWVVTYYVLKVVSDELKIRDEQVYKFYEDFKNFLKK